MTSDLKVCALTLSLWVAGCITVCVTWGIVALLNYWLLSILF